MVTEYPMTPDDTPLTEPTQNLALDVYYLQSNMCS